MISLRARTIAIIGAGPSGIVAAKYLLAEKAFDRVTIFEQRSRLGGVWNATPDELDEDLFTVPQTDALGKIQKPTWKDSRNPQVKEASFLSPIYDRLETNIPRGLMGFQDLDWPADSQLFPSHEAVLQYIEEYAQDVKHLIEFETQVVDVLPTSDSYDSSWVVKTRDLRSNEETTAEYDAVIVANGHFIVPYLPDTPGIRQWNEKFPGAITHSKYFRKPEDFTGKKVIVVGNSASGLDISAQIATASQTPLLWSIRSSSMFNPMKEAGPLRRELPPIQQFLPKTQGVEFEDGSVENDIDAIVFATGYLYSLPFLEKLTPELIGDGERVNKTFKHLFYAPRPTLSFLVLNQRVIPFPMAEAQSAVLARVYSGRLALPPLSEMEKWEEEAIEQNGSGKNFHLLPFPRDAFYINEMSTWAMTAAPREGLANDGKGKIPPVWGEWEFWCRENFPKIRVAFGKKGEQRHGVTTVAELGFSYEDYLTRKADKEKETV